LAARWHLRVAALVDRDLARLNLEGVGLHGVHAEVAHALREGGSGQNGHHGGESESLLDHVFL
jgi:hypothetical protein